MAVLPDERCLLRRLGEAAAAAQVRGSEEFGDGFSSGVLQSSDSFYQFFLTSSASEASAPCDPDRTEIGIVALGL